MNWLSQGTFEEIVLNQDPVTPEGISHKVRDKEGEGLSQLGSRSLWPQRIIVHPDAGPGRHSSWPLSFPHSAPTVAQDGPMWVRGMESVASPFLMSENTVPAPATLQPALLPWSETDLDQEPGHMTPR